MRVSNFSNTDYDYILTEEVTKVPSATWGSPDGTLVLYVQYDDSLVSELKFPRLSESIGGAGAARTGFLLPAFNNSMHTVYPEHVTIRYPTVQNSIKILETCLFSRSS